MFISVPKYIKIKYDNKLIIYTYNKSVEKSFLYIENI